MNKFILLLGLLFFPHILDQIGLFVLFLFLFLFCVCVCVKRSRYCQDDHIQIHLR